MNDRRRGIRGRDTERRTTEVRPGPQGRRRRHIALIVHGARAEFPGLRHLVEWVRAKGHIVRPRVTWEPNDGAMFAREAIDAGADTIVACGGDGTVNEVVNGIEGTRVALGIVPIGTANDFARQVGIPADADHAMDVILQRKARRFDTATLNGRRFLNVSTGGIGAEATAETPSQIKAALGQFAYAVSGLRKFAEFVPNHGIFKGGGYSLECDFLMFAVGSAMATGGGTLVTPHASTTDGLLDLCVVERMPRREFARTVLRVRRGEHVGEDGVHYVRVPDLTIEGTKPISVNVDGEMSDSRRLDYRARPKDLWVHVVHRPGEQEGGRRKEA